MLTPHPYQPQPLSHLFYRRAVRPRVIRTVLFDWDGTLSLIRSGWQPIMLEVFMAALPQISTHPREVAELTRQAKAVIDKLTGRQTIYQMMALVEMVAQREGKPKTAEEYKADYLALLEEKLVNARRLELAQDSTRQERYTVRGSRALLTALENLGVRMIVFSGTDQPDVEVEASLLGLSDFFDGIYGATPDLVGSSKGAVLQRLMAKEKVKGEECLVFGDGFVELEEGKKINALTVAMATNETNPESGQFDEWKVNRLRQLEPDVFACDFSDWGLLLKLLIAIH